MNVIVNTVKELKDKIGDEVDKTYHGFENMRDAGEDEWFSELCFCILTANASAEMGIRAQKLLGYDGFSGLSLKELADGLKSSGYRFYNKRAEYIVGARWINGALKKTIMGMNNQFKAREWLAQNIKGIGYKEASHFLRNVGYGDLAILDKHILYILRKYDLIGDFKTVNKKRYIAIEHVLREIAQRLHMPVGKLDLYLWYMKTGKVLK
ncbi:MAG: N-glycosylase/DNA lyase [Candidatus Micrarchaeia archaeon]